MDRLNVIPWFQIESIQLGPVTVQVWGLLVFMGFAVGGWIAVKEAKRKHISSETILDLLVWVLASSIVGARLFYVIGHYHEYLTDPISIFQFYEGGMAFFGGFLGSVVAGLIFVRRKKLSLPTIADIVAPAIAAGYAIGRIGCVMIHDHLGSITTVPWGIITPEGVVRHETALYEVVFNGILLFAILWFSRKRIKTDGTLALIFLVWFLIVRFFNDFFRATDLPISDIRTFGLTGAQLIILGIFLFVFSYILVYMRKQKSLKAA